MFDKLSKKNLCILISGAILGAGAVVTGIVMLTKHCSRKKELSKVNVDELCEDCSCDASTDTTENQ